MTAVSVHDAHASLQRLIERALDGEDIVITLEGKPPVRLVPVIEAEPPAKRQLGQLAGEFECPPDSAFFDPLPDDILTAFYGEDGNAVADLLVEAEKSKR